MLSLVIYEHAVLCEDFDIVCQQREVQFSNVRLLLLLQLKAPLAATEQAVNARIRVGPPLH